MRVPTLTGMLKIWALTVLLMLAPGLARACPVCIDQPERTVADHALEDWIVVLARQDDNDPSRFAPVEILRGDAEDIADVPEIPFLVDDATQRTLARNPELSVLLTYGPPGDYTGLAPGSGLWYRHVGITPERRDTLDAILDEGALWDWGMTTDPARFGFFAARIADPDPVIRRMALTEVSRAPYRLIREIPQIPPAEDLLERVSLVTVPPVAPITILLLGLSDAPAAEAAIRRSFDSALTQGGVYAAAWIVAGIESDGPSALERSDGPTALARALERLHGEPALSREERLNMLTALTVTGSARPELRPAIVPVLVETVRRFPDHAGDLAYSFYAWRDWSIVPLYSSMLDGPLDHETRYILEIVVATAQAEQAAAPDRAH